MMAFITPFPSELLPDRVVSNAAMASSNAKLKRINHVSLMASRRLPMSNQWFQIDLAFGHQIDSERVITRLMAMLDHRIKNKAAHTPYLR
jgi:hypothetical protein